MTHSSISLPKMTVLRTTPLPSLAAALLAGIAVAACTPTVKVEPPSEPITINLNVKVDAEVRVKIEEQASEDIAKNDDIF